MDTTTFNHARQEVVHSLPSGSLLAEWPECLKVLTNYIEQDEAWLYRLPGLACAANGGNPEQALPVTVTWTLLRHAAHLMDSVQDRDANPYSRLTPPQNISCATGLIFAAFQQIRISSLNSQQQNEIIGILTSNGLHSSYGQFLGFTSLDEISSAEEKLEHYWKAVILQSGSVLRAGLQAGAALGSGGYQEPLGEFGLAIGVIRQVLDDCRDVLVDAEKPNTLPWLLLHAHHNNTFLADNIALKIKPINHGFSERHQAFKVADRIAVILDAWRQKALQHLDALPQSSARQELKNTLDHVLLANSTS